MAYYMAELMREFFRSTDRLYIIIVSQNSAAHIGRLFSTL